ncbi:hypothetical protein AF335_07770 [Streptomyces eurocidicus]|uniref:Uncharacterized protein n=1 Tax=Streptomyces eurocidicus TaxID=66423 RepID=A0A2N8P0C8_STREU|nr:hypothetical protein [Streptomyces eurocidicus]PNE34473.1 hypothetical protein AF335_07770 [Streptomyces eurocidicus]
MCPIPPPTPSCARSAPSCAPEAGCWWWPAAWAPSATSTPGCATCSTARASIPGGYARDTQNSTLEHPEPRFPNLTLLRDNATHRFADIRGNGTGDGTWVVQWPYQTNPNGTPAINETFYLHPQF